MIAAIPPRVLRQHEAPMRLEIGAQRPDLRLEYLLQPRLIAFEPAALAQYEFGRRNDGLAIDDAERHDIRICIEIGLNRHHQRRVAGVQHVVEHDQPALCEAGRGEREVLGQRRANAPRRYG
jgi:hypothetical protein